MNHTKINFQVVITVVATLYFALFACGAFLIIQQFESIFVSFNAELPRQTSLLIGTYRYWGVLGVISTIILCRVSKSSSSKSMKLLLYLFLLSLILVLFAVWGIYSPTLEGTV
ncbi:hypothetical protein [Thalassotalea profundi]|uniref:DUF4149 domain-containing protein n=1 Tax=Thalassotalea profundi TaxID=2036687 RepID=A0ABQ3IQR9_9GAMM|nr:hypothetical protein [Thalassotalea profundi]GHE91819.1 hypothetical protein GCM10011501_21570 [Thalassotalea profundi]